MIARATLALMLAGPALMGGLVVAPQSAAAQTRKPTVLPPVVDTRERSATSRRSRSLAQRRPLPAAAAKFPPGAVQIGMASWYGGSDWQGHRMSNGDRYEQDRLTAAHATLPMGTKVLVTLTNSSRSVVVTVTDRPGTRTRVIDLSRAAAAALGIMDRGVAQVSLTPL